MASFEAAILQSSLEHVRLRSSWTITVPSQNPNLSLTTLSSSHFLRQLLQSPSALSSPSDRSGTSTLPCPRVATKTAIPTGRGFWLYPTSPGGSRPKLRVPIWKGATMHQPVIGPGESGPSDTEFDDIEWELCCSAREASVGYVPFANLDFARATLDVCRTRMEKLRRDSLSQADATSLTHCPECGGKKLIPVSATQHELLLPGLCLVLAR